MSAARQTYRDYAVAFWDAMQGGDPARANRQTEAAEVIVARWRNADSLDEFLEPLLVDDLAEVRLAAASQLLGSALSERAVGVLEDLEKPGKGFIAMTARLRLLSWRKEVQRR